ncbi:MAG: protein-glutamate methylesterase/protein-glutamine glutaminase [Terracidiphilus sp.]
MTGARRTRVLIVDDSAAMRSLLRSVVASDPSLEVAGTAADGASALPLLDIVKPDLILLDVEMPVMDGLATLRELRKRGRKVPVIVCSALTQRGAKVTIEALAGGASDYVAKPAGQPNRDIAAQNLAQDLLPKIHALTGRPLPQRTPQPVLPGAHPPAAPPAAGLLLQFAPELRPQPIFSAPAVVAIGVSTGGPAALDVLLPELAANFPLPILVVQHMPEVFTRLFAERLNQRCRLRVREAAEGASVRAGNIYIARGNWHMEVLGAASAAAAATLHLTQAPLENHCRPSVDPMLRSAARAYGAGVLAVILTGMGSDGMNGCRAVREAGGSVLAQDQASSTVWGMPGAVAGAGLAHKILPLASMAAEIQRMASRAGADARETSPMPEPHRMAV